MRVLKIILAALFSLLAACLLAFAVFILLDPVVGTKQPPVTLDTDQIFVPQEPEAVTPEAEPEEEAAPEDLPEEEAPEAEEVPAAQEDEEMVLARAYVQSMTLEEKIWQLFLVTPESLTGVGRVTMAGETTQKAVQTRPVGGIVYFAANLEDREQTVNLLKNVQSYAKTPLFLGVDEEGGTVSRAGSNPELGVTSHAAAAEYGQRADMKEVYEVGRTMALELGALGFNLNFAPVADLSNNAGNTEIGTRAYSSDPEVAAAMVSAMVQGLQQNGMASCLKHFPGHGSAVGDSHQGTAVSDRTVEQLRETEWVPFQAGIQQEAAFVMLSHLTNENLSELPASLSAEVVSALRQELGFDGIIITDSLQMRAVTDLYSSDQAAVMALCAGVDMLLMPNDLQKAYDGVLKAVQDGALTEDRITESTVRILAAKYRLGLMERETVQ